MDLNQAFELDTTPISPSQIETFSNDDQQMTVEGQDSAESSRSQFKQVQKQTMEMFWNQQLSEIQNTTAFKNNNQLPLARIKRIMKSDEDVKMISADTPILFSKACELLIMELTLRGWLQTEDCNRRTLQRCDIARAIKHSDGGLDFLANVVPYCNHKDDDAARFIQEYGPWIPTHRWPFPNLMEVNKVFPENNSEISQQHMIKTSIFPGDFNYQSDLQ